MMKSNIIIIGALLALISFVAADVSENDGTRPASEEPVKRVHVLNPGEKEFLSPNLIGVQNIAVSHIPVTMDFINIIDAFREVVDGVKYEIVLNAVNTTDNNTEVVCRLVVLEKPWLTTLWGDKVRLLQESNCTNEELTDSHRDRKSLEEKYETNAIFTGSRNELTTDDMSRLESQIIASSSPQLTRQRTTTTTTESVDIAQSEQVTESTIVTEPTDEQSADTQPGAGSGADNSDLTAQEPIIASASTEASTTTTEKIPELSDEEKKWLDGILSIGAFNFETSLQNKNTQSANKAQINDQEEADKRSKRGLAGGVRQLDEQELKLEEESLSKSLSKIATGDGPSYTIVKVYSGTKQVVAGSLTKLDVDLLDGKTGEKERCIVSLWAQPWLKEDGYEVSFECKDKPKSVHRHSRSVDEVPTLGGVRPLSEAELKDQEKIFSQSLAKIAAGDGPSYRISKLVSGTTQVVSGTAVEVKAILIDDKTGETVDCDLSLWSQPWLQENGYQLTFKCKDKPQSVHRYSR